MTHDPRAREPWILRYFDCRGRAEALRYWLRDAGVEFSDERVAVSLEWFEKKEAPGFAGPYGALPVLCCGELRFGETLPIVSYMARELGHYVKLDARQIAELEMPTSIAYLDLILPAGELLWSTVGEDEQLRGLLEAFTRRVTRRLAWIERELGRRAVPYFGGSSPAAADYFMAEGLDAWRELLGARFEGPLARCPRLVRIREAILERPAVAAYIASGKRPAPFSGSPHEFVLRERIRALAG